MTRKTLCEIFGEPGWDAEAQPERSTAGRALAALAHTPRARACAHCRTEFQARGRGLYCCRSCRQLAYRVRDRAAKRQA